MSDKKFKLCFVGGDARQKYAAERLAASLDISTLGECFGKCPNDAAERAFYNAGAVVLPIPAIKAERTMGFCDIVKHAQKNGSAVLGGGFTEYMKSYMEGSGVRYFDYMDDEAFTIKNAYLTAEGALNLISNKLSKDIKSASFAILGYGRIGSALGELLSALHARVCVFARRDESLTLARERGLEAATLGELSERSFDVIINTVPSRIISNETLLSISPNSILIELASAPGGFDLEIAEQIGLAVINGGGLPGKYAPESAGYAVADVLLKILEKEHFL